MCNVTDVCWNLDGTTWHISYVWCLLDKNLDGTVSEREFVALPPAGVGAELHEADKQWQAERRREFRNVIDTNHDGKLTKQELLVNVSEY